MTRIELLAPARDYDTGIAAVDHGADALYMGGPAFGARQAAGNGADDVARLAEYARLFGVKVYVAMNTLLDDSDLASAESQAWDMYRVGADALIVQDMAFLRMNLPPVELHASTQTTNISPERVKFLEDVGFSRVILERALSLDDIRTVRRATNVELEAFVHGAICVGHSGQCYMSRSMSGRSGNRGSCSQPCRLPFDLLDSDMKPISRGRHFLSLQDLNLGGDLETLIDAGVTSFKIEGRLKDVDYVKNIVGWYRRRLDEIISHRADLEKASSGNVTIGFDPEPSKSFSRGFTRYFLDAGRRRGIASFSTPKSTGEYLGEVLSVDRDSIIVACSEEVNPGDGICYADPKGALQGTNVNSCGPTGYPGQLRIFPQKVGGFAPGTDIYRNYDHAFARIMDRARIRRSIEVAAVVDLGAEEVTLTLDCSGVSASAVAAGPFDAARDEDKALDTIRRQVARSGDTIFDVTDVKISGEARFIPVSVLNDLRRRALEKLEEVVAANQAKVEASREERPVTYPLKTIDCDLNITNKLSSAFYASHGVDVAALPPCREGASDLLGQEVMRTRYCLREEMGECLKESPKYRGPLFLRHGPYLYELKFDCRRCGMNVIYRGKAKV